MNRTYSELQLHGGKMGNKCHSAGKDDVDIQRVCVCVHRYQLQSLEHHPKFTVISHQKEKSFGNILSNQV